MHSCTDMPEIATNWERKNEGSFGPQVDMPMMGDKYVSNEVINVLNALPKL